LGIVLAGHNLTTTSLLDASDTLITSFTGPFSYAGATPVAFFEISFEQNAMDSLNFTGAAAVPEPSSALLLGTALSLGLLVRKLLAS
jgi:hypothetical protein